jgi:hypothetical protein
MADNDLNTGDRNTGGWNTGNRNTGDWNTGGWNTGNRNTGDWNTGHWNTGGLNTGDRNTGDRNTGHWNTGDWNTGNWNTGGRNTGDRNTGDRNTGHWNTGNLNTGHWNTGHWNTGNLNTGDWNTGNLNTGNWNTGGRNTGFFCTQTPQPTFFDKPWDGTWEQAYALIPYFELPVGAIWTPIEQMTEQEKAENPNHATIGGYLRASTLTIQQAFPLAWAKMNKATQQRFLGLPNFDAEKFLACTGVDVRKPATITIDGQAMDVSADQLAQIRGVLNVTIQGKGK